jgi:hypothetical protein
MILPSLIEQTGNSKLPSAHGSIHNNESAAQKVNGKSALQHFSRSAFRIPTRRHVAQQRAA